MPGLTAAAAHRPCLPRSYACSTSGSETRLLCGSRWSGVGVRGARSAPLAERIPRSTSTACHRNAYELPVCRESITDLRPAARRNMRQGWPALVDVLAGTTSSPACARNPACTGSRRAATSGRRRRAAAPVCTGGHGQLVDRGSAATMAVGRRAAAVPLYPCTTVPRQVLWRQLPQLRLWPRQRALEHAALEPVGRAGVHLALLRNARQQAAPARRTWASPALVRNISIWHPPGAASAPRHCKATSRASQRRANGHGVRKSLLKDNAAAPARGSARRRSAFRPADKVAP